MKLGSLFQDQAGALCWVDGKIVLLSRDEGKKWTIPRGALGEGADVRQKAEEAAWEEVGVLGHAKDKMGNYLMTAGGKMHRIEVYSIEAQKFRDNWPMAGQLQRGLFTPAEAAEKVDAIGLRDIFEKMSRGR